VESHDILVSVCCLTYNHNDYIRHAIDGFLEQNTRFRIEIIVHDDASTDGTTEIIRQYAIEYPDLFRLVLQKKNLFSSGTSILKIYENHVFPLAKGKYIAICEGDDYWTDPLKLQKQVDFMEQNTDYAVCFHNVGFTGDRQTDFYEHINYFNHLFRERENFGFDDLVTDNFIPNCSTLYRNSLQAFPDLFADCIFPDWPLHILYSKTGKVHYINEIMAVHYKHERGLWESESLESRYQMIYRFYIDLLRIAPFESYPIIFESLKRHTNGIIVPDIDEIFRLGFDLGIKKEKEITDTLQNDLDLIFNSKSWKASNFIRIKAETIFPNGTKRRKALAGYYRILKKAFHRLEKKSQTTHDLALQKRSGIYKIFYFRFINIKPWPSGNPLVSVIIPNFNYGKFIGESIDSVLKQTFKNFEIIVVDGGSTDPETIKVLNQINHPKITVLLREGRHLVGDNRNYGINRASGKYICCLDADDLVDPTYLEKALFYLETYRYDVVYPWVQAFGRSNTLWKTTTPVFEEMASQGNPVATIAVFKREAWKTCGGYKDWPVGPGHIPEDWEFWTRMAGFGFRFKHIPEPLMLYRVHENSLTDLCGTSHETQLKIIRSENSILFQQKFQKIRARNSKRIYFVKNPFVNLTQTKTQKNILLALPFMITGGVDTLLLNVFSRLSESYRISIITTIETPEEFGDNTPKYQKITREIYKLQKFLGNEEQMKKYILYLLEAKQIDVVFIAGCEFMYHCLPAVKPKHKNLKVVDFLFNETGHIVNNRKYARLINMNIAENETIRKLLIQTYNENPNKIRLIPNGIHINRFIPISDKNSLKTKYGLNENSFQVLYLGRFSEEKRPKVVIEIAKICHDHGIVFFLAGNGPQFNETIDLIKRENLESNIKAPGFVDSIEILSVTDVLILPSIIDGRPNVVLEALAMGIPVIASNVGGLPSLVIDGYNGFLIEPADLSSFAEKIILLKSNPELQNTMGLNAQKYAREFLDDKPMHEQYLNLMKELLEEKSGPNNG